MKKISLLLIAVPLLMLASFNYGYNFPRGDVNQDGVVNITDVSVLVDFLLDGTWPPDSAALAPGEYFTVNGVTFKMIQVDGGTFQMGATPEQGSNVNSNEKPVHQVTVSDFLIGQTEVTQGLWRAVMGTNPSNFTSANGYPEDLERPVENVSWNDCQLFITKLNQLTGREFRLPYEAEWEFAARGGNKSQGYVYAGSNNIYDVAWYKYTILSQVSGEPGYGTQAVAQRRPNELYLFDMSGNVYEWVQDWYALYGSSAQVDPTGPASGSYRVYRGGCFNYDATNCRVSHRHNGTPVVRFSALGLRLALTPLPSDTIPSDTIPGDTVPVVLKKRR